MNKSESGREFHVTGSPPLTILATFTVPAPISVAMRLRRVWYRSAAQIAASEGVAFVLSPKSRRFIYVAANTENLESVSRR